MKKTSIYLEPEVDRALARRAGREGVTKAELIRRALREAAAGSVAARPRARGVFESSEDLAESVDRELRASGFGES